MRNSALEEYRSIGPAQFIVFPPPQTDSTAYLCAANEMPDFAELSDDVYIFSPDFAWTMVYTHESNWGLGPYFARKEWQTWADT